MYQQVDACAKAYSILGDAVHPFNRRFWQGIVHHKQLPAMKKDLDNMALHTSTISLEMYFLQYKGTLRLPTSDNHMPKKI